jgi:hypothetical protein
VITSVEKWGYVQVHSMSKPQNHGMQFSIEIKEMVIWKQEKREKYLGITKGNQTFQLIALNNTNIFK